MTGLVQSQDTILCAPPNEINFTSHPLRGTGAPRLIKQTSWLRWTLLISTTKNTKNNNISYLCYTGILMTSTSIRLSDRNMYSTLVLCPIFLWPSDNTVSKETAPLKSLARGMQRDTIPPPSLVFAFFLLSHVLCKLLELKMSTSYQCSYPLASYIVRQLWGEVLPDHIASPPQHIRKLDKVLPAL